MQRAAIAAHCRRHYGSLPTRLRLVVNEVTAHSRRAVISLSFCFNYKKRQSVTFLFKQLITNGLRWVYLLNKVTLFHLGTSFLLQNMVYSPVRKRGGTETSLLVPGCRQALSNSKTSCFAGSKIPLTAQ